MNDKSKGGRPKMQKGVISRILKMLFADYRPQLIVVAVCIVLTSIASSVSSLFMSSLITYIDKGIDDGWSAVSKNILALVGVMCSIYVVGIISSFTYTRLMALAMFLENKKTSSYNIC